MFSKFTLLLSSALFCLAPAAQGSSVVLNASGTASGTEYAGNPMGVTATGTFSGTVTFDTVTFQATAEDITFNFSSGSTYHFDSTSIAGLTTAPNPLSQIDYSLVQSGTTTVNVYDILLPSTPHVFDFTVSDALLTSYTGDPLTAATIQPQGSKQGPYTAVGSLTDPSALPPVPTPEPSSLLLLGTGALGVFGVVRRRFGRS